MSSHDDLLARIDACLRELWDAYEAEKARAVAAETALAIALWTCPDCAFTFAAEHEDTDGGHSCPVCAEAALLARVVAAETALAATDEAVTELLMAIAAEQPGFQWTAERTADAVDVLTKVVLPLAAVPDQPNPTGDDDE